MPLNTQQRSLPHGISDRPQKQQPHARFKLYILNFALLCMNGRNVNAGIRLFFPLAHWAGTHITACAALYFSFFTHLHTHTHTHLNKVNKADGNVRLLWCAINKQISLFCPVISLRRYDTVFFIWSIHLWDSHMVLPLTSTMLEFQKTSSISENTPQNVLTRAIIMENDITGSLWDLTVKLLRQLKVLTYTM